MGNQPSQMGQVAEICEKKRHRTGGNDSLLFDAIDEEGTEINEEYSEPLSIDSGNGNPCENKGEERSDQLNFSEIENYDAGTFPSPHATFQPRSEPPKSEELYGLPPPLRAPRRRGRSSTLGPTQGNLIRQQILGGRSTNLIPTVFKLYCPRHPQNRLSPPKEVFVGGSFNDWNLVPMKGSQTGLHWCIIINLPEGTHEYKFRVDDTWVHNPREKSVDDGLGGKNNVIVVHKTDFEVFDALDMDCRDVAARKKKMDTSTSENIEYGQEIPDIFKKINLGETYVMDGSDRNENSPPILPPHLLQVILNKDTPLSCEPTLLPRPNHVMLNHMYALSIKDRVMVMSATQRFQKKYVTTVLYRPVEI